MSKKNEESPRVSASPNPPPLPVAFISSRQERTFAARKSALRKYCCTPTATKNTWDCLFDEGYRADVSINTDNGGVLYAHASILGVNSAVFKSMLSLKKSRPHGRCGHQRSITINGVPPEAVQVFIKPSSILAPLHECCERRGDPSSPISFEARRFSKDDAMATMARKVPLVQQSSPEQYLLKDASQWQLPAEKYPYLFSKGSLFGRFRYFLPCLCISVFALVVAVGSFWILVNLAI
ncbi:uncharacterized protein LOC107019839 [Solanum pennellii]|uniref:Uncharacterized protein LOC107019839 n=1 Tax=Solanum pennellii TaxID=28526 RepID=A0ABM1VA73_SOLPN|nr:uncharacterized protein LOC107019839 [Solanum pennellii]